MNRSTQSNVTVDFSGRWPRDFGRAQALAVARTAAEIGGFRGMGRIDLSVVSDEEIRRINREHRGIDKVTDVLSFRLSEDETFGALADIGESSEYLGDILICLPQVRRQAREIGRSSATELALMVAHGTLHLLGYDHCDLRDETRMFGLQQETLMRLNYL